MGWFWPNLAIGAIFFGSWAGIPLWMVLKHPTWGSVSAHGHGEHVLLAPVPLAEEFQEEVRAGEFVMDAALVD
ncbi:MAG TPA: hypothetical protein VMB74_05190 [Streptosporangiaceae bacterium]|nr:hypothetical protein [Streptosporangiaceae bacterium]